jgi:hypothetical protein
MKSTGFVQLIDVPRLASVRKGDTIDRYAIRNFPRKHKHWNY